MLEYMTSQDAPDLSYARESDILHRAEALKPDIRTPVYFPIPQASLPLPYLPSNDGPTGPIAWVGPAGTVANLHWDPEHNLYAQVRGRKFFIILSPEESHLTYPNTFSVADLTTRRHFQQDHGQLLVKLARIAEQALAASYENTVTAFRGQLYRELNSGDISALFDFLLNTNNCHVNAEHPNFGTHPAFTHAKRLRTVLNPGDLLFLPFLWRHYVRSLDPSISVNWVFRPDGLEVDSYSVSLKTVVEHLVP